MVDYLEARDAESLAPLGSIGDRPARLLAAVQARQDAAHRQCRRLNAALESERHERFRLGGANPAPERIIRAIISGRVQGVGFRAWMQAEAEALGLGGGCATASAATSKPCSPVRRRPSRRCRRRLWRGPPAARVDRVTITQAGEGDLAVIGGRGFRQIATI